MQIPARHLLPIGPGFRVSLSVSFASDIPYLQGKGVGKHRWGFGPFHPPARDTISDLMTLPFVQRNRMPYFSLAAGEIEPFRRYRCRRRRRRYHRTPPPFSISKWLPWHEEDRNPTDLLFHCLRRDVDLIPPRRPERGRGVRSRAGGGFGSRLSLRTSKGSRTSKGAILIPIPS